MLIDCQHATRLLSDAQERALTPAERLQLHLHLPICNGCRRFRTQLAMMRNMMRDYAEKDAPDGEIQI